MKERNEKSGLLGAVATGKGICFQTASRSREDISSATLQLQALSQEYCMLVSLKASANQSSHLKKRRGGSRQGGYESQK